MDGCDTHKASEGLLDIIPLSFMNSWEAPVSEVVALETTLNFNNNYFMQLPFFFFFFSDDDFDQFDKPGAERSWRRRAGDDEWDRWVEYFYDQLLYIKLHCCIF